MENSRYSVVFDANVLYAAPLRDLLLRLTVQGHIFRSRWTNTIHDEWMENLLKNRPDLSLDRLKRTRALINKAVPDALIDKNLYEPFIKGISLPDPDDRHVLAAAIVSQSRYILTFNVKDFPEASLQKFQIEAKHPDEFISELVDHHPSKVLAALRSQQKSLKNPPKTLEDVMASLVKNGLVSSMVKIKMLL